MYESIAATNSFIGAYTGSFGSVDVDSNTFNEEPLTIGISFPGKSYSLNKSLTSISTNSNNSGSSTISVLFK